MTETITPRQETMLIWKHFPVATAGDYARARLLCAEAYALGVQAGVRQSADIVESFKGRLIGDDERVIENIKDLYTEVAVAVSSIGRTPDFLSEKAGSTPATATNSAARPWEEPTS